MIIDNSNVKLFVICLSLLCCAIPFNTYILTDEIHCFIDSSLIYFLDFIIFDQKTLSIKSAKISG